MQDSKPIFEAELETDLVDPDELPLRDRTVSTQPYDLVVESLLEQIKSGTVFIRPLSERPKFQRQYVWSDDLASKLVESIILNVPIPPCYLSQNEEFELDVIDGQQRLFSIYRFVENQFPLRSLEVLKELVGLRFFELPIKHQRQIKTHTLRCILIENRSHPDIKFDVFERLNTNTVPLNAQELRNCVNRGSLNDLLGELAASDRWLKIVGRKKPDKRLRDEELILRFFAYHIHGLQSYRTPQKHWLNDTAKAGRKYSSDKIENLRRVWEAMLDVSLAWFEPAECFRRPGAQTINKALFDLVCHTASRIEPMRNQNQRQLFRRKYDDLLAMENFQDLISRAVDHTKRTRQRFEIWDRQFAEFMS
jgi:hypothetical protein